MARAYANPIRNNMKTIDARTLLHVRVYHTQFTLSLCHSADIPYFQEVVVQPAANKRINFMPLSMQKAHTEHLENSREQQ